MAKTPTDIRSLARSHGPTMLQVLKNIANNTEAPHSARVAAAIALLDRGYGKPEQQLDVTTKNYDISGEPEPTVDEWKDKHVTTH